MNFGRAFILAFIPVFVAMDPIGILPLYISFTKGLEPTPKRRLTFQALGTALVVTILFMFIGKALFKILGITIPDFQIGGGLLLLVISIKDLTSHTKELRDPGQAIEAGVVPLGIPLIAGPAVLTTELLLLQQYGILPTAMALLANLFLAGIGFMVSDRITRFFGESGVTAISKIITLLLAAIAVMMIRVGIQAAFFQLK